MPTETKKFKRDFENTKYCLMSFKYNRRRKLYEYGKIVGA